MKILTKVLVLVLVATLCAAFFAACGNKPAAAGGNPYESELIGKGKIVVGISPDYPPYESLNTAGQIEGFDIDMANEVAKYMSEGGSDVAVEFKSMDFDTIITALQTGQVDLGISAFTYNPDRDVLFSTPYLVSEQLIVVTAESGIVDIDGLKGKRIGAGNGTTGFMAAEETIEGAQLSSPGDYNIMFEALKNGALDAVVCDGLVAKNFSEANDLVVLEEALIDEENSIIIKKGNDELLKAVNAAVEKFKASDKYAEFQKKWGIIAS